MISTTGATDYSSVRSIHSKGICSSIHPSKLIALMYLLDPEFRQVEQLACDKHYPRTLQKWQIRNSTREPSLTARHARVHTMTANPTFEPFLCNCLQVCMCPRRKKIIDIVARSCEHHSALSQAVLLSLKHRSERGLKEPMRPSPGVPLSSWSLCNLEHRTDRATCCRLLPP